MKKREPNKHFWTLNKKRSDLCQKALRNILKFLLRVQRYLLSISSWKKFNLKFFCRNGAIIFGILIYKFQPLVKKLYYLSRRGFGNFFFCEKIPFV